MTSSYAGPALTPTGERLYAQLAPTFFGEDSQYGWAGAHLCAALATMFDQTVTVVMTPGKPLYAVLGEPMNIPAAWLPWLAQFVGLTLTQSPSVAVSRQWIDAPLGYTRGKVSAMVLAAQATLTGAKTIYFYPRYGGSAFLIKAATNTAETPNPAATQEAIESMMAAWDVLEYAVLTGGTLAVLEAAHPTLALLEAAHSTVSSMELEPAL